MSLASRYESSSDGTNSPWYEKSRYHDDDDDDSNTADADLSAK